MLTALAVAAPMRRLRSLDLGRYGSQAQQFAELEDTLDLWVVGEVLTRILLQVIRANRGRPRPEAKPSLALAGPRARMRR